MVRGTKFNSKVENVLGEDYVGMKIKRIIGKCSQCNALFSYKTDLQNAGYTMESGASRNFELWRDTRASDEVAEAERDFSEKMDPMKALEKRTEESRRQIEEMDALTEIKEKLALRVETGLGPSTVLEALACAPTIPSRNGEGCDDDADAEQARAVFAAARSGVKRLRGDLDAVSSQKVDLARTEVRIPSQVNGDGTDRRHVRKTGALGVFGARFVVLPKIEDGGLQGASSNLGDADTKPKFSALHELVGGYESD